MKDPLFHYTIIPTGKDAIQDDALRMPFLPDDLREALVAARATLEIAENPVVLAHYFLADGSWDWYAYAGEPAPTMIAKRPDDFLFYGWIRDGEYPGDAEFGEFLLSHLLEMHSYPHGLPVEREWAWEATPLSKVMSQK